MQLCHKIVIYVVNLVYIAYIYISLLQLYYNEPLPIIVIGKTHKKQMKSKENGICPPDMPISLFGSLLAPFP
jgi:hypothetical protein